MVGLAAQCLVNCVMSYKSHIPTQSHQTIEIRNFMNFSVDDFLIELEECPLASVEEYSNVDEASQNGNVSSLRSAISSVHL